MISTLHSTTIKLNNRGVTYLENGRFEAAVDMFCKALESSKQLLHDDESDAEMQESCEIRQTPCTVESLEEAASSRPCHFQEMKDDMITTQPYPQNFIFRKPFRMPMQGYIEYSDVQYSVTCMFNLALCHHLWAHESTDSAMASLEISTRLYELSYSLLMTTEEELLAIFSLAIVNNLGQIHKALENTRKAEQCFEHLLSTLMFFCEMGEFEIIGSLDGFLSSVIPLMLTDPLTALAA
jgi:tetratricopeptide (TPR) repeat protein